MNDKQMRWMYSENSGEHELHWREKTTDSWKLYTSHPSVVQDPMPDCSKGYGTFMVLLKQGWELVKST